MKVHLLPTEFSGAPDVTAMLQAFYSRSLMPIEQRLTDLGSDMSSVRKALRSYYIGYGHRSIGQCGTTTLFIEDVPFYVAKAIQHHALYNGQEASTRYIDFSQRKSTNEPSAAPWFDLYDRVLSIFKQAAATALGLSGKELSKQENNAVNAWAFDRARGWLPSNALTSLSWHTTFDNLNNHLRTMYLSSDQLIVDAAVAIHNVAAKAYPDAVVDLHYSGEESALNYKSPVGLSAWLDTGCSRTEDLGIFHLNKSPHITPYLIQEAANSRTPVSYSQHPILTQTGFIFETFTGALDYGAWRELSRHRTLQMDFIKPLITLHKWYKEQLYDAAPYATIGEADSILDATAALETDDENIAPLGGEVQFSMWGSLAALLYVMELRSGKTVHPILRSFTKDIAHILHGLNIPNHIDTSQIQEGEFLRRGKQTIEKDLL